MDHEATTPGGLPHSVHRRDVPVSRRLHALIVLLGCLSAVAALAMAPAAAATGRHTPGRHAVPQARADDGAYVSAVKPLDGRTTDLTVSSPAMHAAMPVRLILPRTWSADSHRTFPTVYLLQGASDDYTSWTRETDVEQLSSRANVIIAMPEGGRAGFYTDWWNDGREGGPKWETFHTVELPQILERSYRANPLRAVVGLSEGGLGALNYAARHRGEYVFAGSFSGPVDTADKGLQSSIYLTCLREGVDADLLWGDPVRDRERWEAHNPAHAVGRFRGVKVYLSAATGLPGRFDRTNDPLAGLLEAPAYLPTAALAARLRTAGVDVTADLHLAGTHSWPYWQQELHLAWPSVLASLRAAS